MIPGRWGLFGITIKPWGQGHIWNNLCLEGVNGVIGSSLYRGVSTICQRSRKRCIVNYMKFLLHASQ